MEARPLRVISLGAGVQSSTVALLAADGELGPVDAAIFADTRWEPKAVYEHLMKLAGVVRIAGLPTFQVSAGSMRDIDRQKDFYDGPFFLKRKDGSTGITQRQCTNQLKIRPIRAKLRELLSEAGMKKEPGAVELLMGISLDEAARRMKDSDVQWIKNVYPLVERGWDRQDCKQYLAENGWDVPRSACIGCPFHTDGEWREMRDDRPDEFQDAVDFERELQATPAGRRNAIPFLHAARIPLDQVDLSTAEDHGQTTFDDECDGYCGV